MTDLALSQQLNQWKMRLDTITNNVMDLYGAESSKVIRARLKDPANGFSGVTQARAARAIDMLDDLVELYTRLANVVDEASSLVSKGSVFRKNEERLNELLNGRSILMQTQHVLVRNRGLLEEGNREVRATPSEALTTMEQAFAEARDAVTAVADAISHVEPRLQAIGQKITALDSWARALGVARPASITDTSQLITRVERDPIGCVSEVDQIERAVAQWRAELDTIDADHKAIQAFLARGKAAIAELRDLVARANAAYAEAQEKIADSAQLAPPLKDDDVVSLAAWLVNLEHNTEAGRLAAVKVGMANWEQTCKEQMEAEQSSYTHCRGALDEMAEIRGRFTALCAKADALKSRGVAFGAAVEALRSEGKRILDALPFDLTAGKRAVEAFAAALSATPK